MHGEENVAEGARIENRRRYCRDCTLLWSKILLIITINGILGAPKDLSEGIPQFGFKTE